MAIILSGFIAQVVVWAIMALISEIVGSYGQFDGSISESVVSIACFGLVGLPLFGFLFSSAYSPSESSGKNSQAVDINLQ